MTWAIAAGAAIEAGWRAWRNGPPGPAAEWLSNGLLLGVGVAAAGGLGLLLSGSKPDETLHLGYAVLAFGALPVASSLARGRTPRQRALATLIGGVIAVVLIARLFQTG